MKIKKKKYFFLGGGGRVGGGGVGFSCMYHGSNFFGLSPGFFFVNLMVFGFIAS